MTQTIADILQMQPGNSFKLFALITHAEKRKTKTGKAYLHLTFSDKKDNEEYNISGNIWNVSEEQIKQFPTKTVVFLQGECDMYQNTPQVKILSIRVATDTEPNNPNDYLAALTAPEPLADIKQELNYFYNKITEPEWHNLVLELIKMRPKQYATTPAAKNNHHAYTSGLLYHTLSILRLAKAVCQYHPKLNKSLLYAGIILHDYGKTLELVDFPLTQYSNEGYLLGHISIIDGEICALCERLHYDPNSEKIVLLRHLVLAHHGKLEYGSPVNPQLPEAAVLNHLDDLDATLAEFSSVKKTLDPGQISKPIFALHNSRVYKPSFEQDESTK